MMTLSGQKAQLNVGGRVPVKSTTVTQDNVTENFEYYDYGLNVNITPEVDMNGHIRMDINISISDVSFGNTKDNNNNIIPQFLNRSARSVVSCYNGETIVISGLIRREENTSHDKVPFLSRIPGIGRIFNNRVDKHKKSELLKLLTPHLIKNERPTVNRISKKKANIKRPKAKAEKPMNKEKKTAVARNNGENSIKDMIQRISNNLKLSPADRKKKIAEIFGGI